MKSQAWHKRAMACLLAASCESGGLGGFGGFANAGINARPTWAYNRRAGTCARVDSNHVLRELYDP